TGALTGESTVRDLLISVAPLRLRAAAKRLDAAELVMMERDDETAQMRYAAALAEWGDAGGYDAEVLWDACCLGALGIGYERCRWREVGTLSGGEQKHIVLGAPPWRSVSRTASCSGPCGGAPPMSCCSTSRTTTWTCPPSAGWSSNSPRP